VDIQNHVKEVIRAFGGIKSSLPQGALAATDCEDCVNFVPRRGRLRKLWGTSRVFNSGSGAGPIQMVARLRDRWLAQHGSAIIQEQAVGQNDFQQIGDILLGEANRAHSAKWENRIFLSNGVENKFLEHAADGSFKYLNLGLLPPGNGAKGGLTIQPDLVVTEIPYIGSDLVMGEEYGYVVTWWDDRTQTESLPWGSYVGEDGLWLSAALAYAYSVRVTVSAADRALRVNIAALKAFGYDADRVTHFIVYRWTQADNATFKRCPTLSGSIDLSQGFRVPIADDYFDDIAAEADLGAVLDASISPPPSGLFYQGYGIKAQDQAAIGARFVEQFRDQLWLFGARFPGNIHGVEPNSDALGYEIGIQWPPQSGIGYASDVGNPDYWKYTYDVGKSTGQEDTGMKKYNDVLMFFKSRSSYRLLGSSPDNYEIREMDPNRGFTVPGSVQSTTIGVVGIGEGGFTLFTGAGEGVLIADELFDHFARINMQHADKISSAFDPLEEKYECSVPLDGAVHNTHVFSLDCKTRSWALTRRAFGAAAYELSGGKISVSLLGDRQNGRLYTASDLSKVTLDGQTMHGKWRSRAVDFGLPGDLKSVQMVEVTARGRMDFRISIDLITDFGQADSSTATEEDCAPDLRGDKWAEDEQDDAGMNWDHGQWSKGTEKKKFTILIQGVGKNFNLVIRNSDRDADRACFEIEEVVIHASRLSGEKNQ
jgi:hypothetical protein